MAGTDPQAGQRVVVFAPFGRDAGVLRDALAGQDIATRDCATPAELYDSIGEQALLLLVTEEGLAQCPLRELQERLAAQPLWSDLPIVALAGSARAASAGGRLGALAALGNVTLIERPLSREALLMAVRAALRARALQFQLRDQLAQLENHAAELERRVEQRSAALAREVEERKRAEQALAEAQRLESLGRLTGGVAHDFNNLLQVVAGAVELLRLLTGSAGEPRVARALDSIARATGKGARLTQQLLAYARRQPLASSTIDLRAQLDGMAGMLRPALGPAIALEVDAEDGLWQVSADPTQLEVALLNLAINARDAMPGGGVVTLRLRNRSLDGAAAAPALAGDFVCIELSDQGSGMSEATAARAFEPFYTTKPVGKGTGMGLSQVDGFARQSGGAAFIRREAAGTTVGLLLPADTCAGAACPVPVENELALPAGLRVLVVDDDPMVAEVAAALFERFGCSVACADSADAALAAGVDGVDLVFSDVMMPGSMDGIGLAREVNARHPGLPVVLASGYVLGPERLQGVDAAFVSKPYSAEQVLAIAARELARAPARGQRAA